MTTLTRGTVVSTVLIALTLAFGSAVSAQNQTFLSTSLASSDAWHSLQFTAAVGGALDKIRVTFPPGTLAAPVGIGDLVIGGVMTRAVISIDTVDPDRAVVDLTTTRTIVAGTRILLEVVGLVNPIPGDHQVGIELLEATGTVLETLAPIPFSTAAPAGGGSGDITGVTAGPGLSGGGTSGNVTLNINTTLVQRRVTGTCALGSAVRVVRQDGTVTCEPVAGGVTSVATGAGLTGGPITTTGTIGVATGGITSSLLAAGAVTGAKLAADSVGSGNIVNGSIGSADVNTGQIQARVAGTCAAGNAIRVIDASGGVTCEVAGGGGAANGWTDGGTVVSLSTATDNVGIGTTTPASKLHVVSTAGGALPPRLQSSATNGFAAGWDFYLGATGKGYVGVPDSAAAFGAGELILFGGTGTKTSLWAGQTRTLTVDTTGKVGIGTTSPTSQLEIVGQDGLKIRGFQPLLTLQDDNAASKQGFVQSVDGGVGLITNSRRALVLRDSDGLVSLRALQILGGADLSENFDVRGPDGLGTGPSPGDVPPGTLVAIDPKNPGQLIVSHQAYDHRVAGIVSGAGDVKPGMVMGQEGTLGHGKHPVALSGRVYCWVDASQGPVEPGDLLTTSDTPGHAMKVTDRARAQGAIVGKAMTPLATGKGLVLVLVTLQ